MTMQNNVENRWKQHIQNSKLEYPPQSISFNIKRYGLDNFTFDIIEECDNNIICERERYWIKEYNSFLYGMNEQRGSSIGTYVNKKKHNLRYDVSYRPNA